MYGRYEGGTDAQQGMSSARHLLWIVAGRGGRRMQLWTIIMQFGWHCYA